MKCHILVLLGIAVFGSLFASPAPESPVWVAYALRLTGESGAVRRAALYKLKAIPNLHEQLRAALTGPHKYLALDAITAIPLPSLLPELIARSESDENGAFYLAINSLLDSGNREKISEVYRERLRRSKTLSVPAEVVLLDTLGRMGVYLSVDDLHRRLKKSAFEVRSAALYHARYLIRDQKKPAHLTLIKEALVTPPYQLRVQAIHLIADLPAPLRSEGQKLLSICATDKNTVVREECTRVKEIAK